MKSKNSENNLNNDFLLEEDLRKARNRVKDAIRRKKPDEMVVEHKQKVKDIAETILLLNSLRHSGTGKDVDFLNNLELDYLMRGYVSNHRLTQNIAINEQYIMVSGMSVRRFDEQDELNKEAGIFKSTDGKQTLYKLKSAKRKAASMKHDILSTTQLKKLISLMPGDTNEEKTINFSNIFNLEFGGYYDFYSSSVREEDVISSYWITSSTRDRTFSLGIMKEKVGNTKRASMYNAHSLRCIRKEV